jgi:hypothetical protein
MKRLRDHSSTRNGTEAACLAASISSTALTPVRATTGVMTATSTPAVQELWQQSQVTAVSVITATPAVVTSTLPIPTYPPSTMTVPAAARAQLVSEQIPASFAALSDDLGEKVSIGATAISAVLEEKASIGATALSVVPEDKAPVVAAAPPAPALPVVPEDKAPVVAAAPPAPVVAAAILAAPEAAADLLLPEVIKVELEVDDFKTAYDR